MYGFLKSAKDKNSNAIKDIQNQIKSIDNPSGMWIIKSSSGKYVKQFLTHYNNGYVKYTSFKEKAQKLSEENVYSFVKRFTSLIGDEKWTAEKAQIVNESADLKNMSSSELKIHIRNNFEATRSNIEELVDATKDYTDREMMSVSYSLGITAGGLYCAIMKSKYNKNVPI